MHAARSRLGGRVRSGGGLLDEVGVRRVDGCSNCARVHALRVHLHHGTRDAEADLSGWGHGVELDASVWPDATNVAVAVAAMTGVPATAAEAGHVAHQLAVRHLKLV